MVNWAEPLEDDESLSDESLADVVRAEMAVPGSHMIDTASPLMWTCRLNIHFIIDGKPVFGRGTGFLVSLPFRSSKDLIMTAGHNLISRDGIYAQHIDVWFWDTKTTIKVQKDKGEYFTSKSYEKDPSEKNAVNDYGFIMIERKSEEDRGGFGYTLLIGKKNLCQMEAIVFGFPAVTKGGKVEVKDIPRNARGKIESLIDGQLRYLVSTEKGQSGGPVCILHNQYYTVVGIHNYGWEEKPEDGNRGSVLTCNILFEILEPFYGEISLELMLKLQEKRTDRHSNIFLKIPPGRSARVLAQRGKDKYTTFSFVPVETYQHDDERFRSPKYIVATPHLKPPTYLVFNTKRRPRGLVTTAGEQDLIDNRPAEKNVVGLVSIGEPTTFKVHTFQEPKHLLMIDKEMVDALNSQDSCDCTVPECKGVYLVNASGNESNKNTRFFKD